MRKGKHYQEHWGDGDGCSSRKVEVGLGHLLIARADIGQKSMERSCSHDRMKGRILEEASWHPTRTPDMRQKAENKPSF